MDEIQVFRIIAVETLLLLVRKGVMMKFIKFGFNINLNVVMLNKNSHNLVNMIEGSGGVILQNVL